MAQDGAVVEKGRSVTHSHQPHQGLWRPPSVFLDQILFLPSCIDFVAPVTSLCPDPVTSYRCDLVL